MEVVWYVTCPAVNATGLPLPSIDIYHQLQATQVVRHCSECWQVYLGMVDTLEASICTCLPLLQVLIVLLVIQAGRAEAYASLVGSHHRNAVRLP